MKIILIFYFFIIYARESIEDSFGRKPMLPEIRCKSNTKKAATKFVTAFRQ